MPKVKKKSAAEDAKRSERNYAPSSSDDRDRMLMDRNGKI